MTYLDCPYCHYEGYKTVGQSGQIITMSCFVPCGMTYEEHQRVAAARREAEKQAHELLVRERVEEQLPRAVIRRVYNELERRVRERG